MKPIAAVCLYILIIIAFTSIKAKPYYDGDTACDPKHVKNCVARCIELGHGNGFCSDGNCYCEREKHTMISSGAFCETGTEYECAQHCLTRDFPTGQCGQNGACVCAFQPNEQDPICTMGGNLTCYMHCHDLGYLSGYCDSYFDCCCTYGITYGDCDVMLYQSQACLSEERTICEAHCMAEGHESFLCTNKQCFCPT